MKIQEKCIPSIVNQAIRTADIVGLKEKGDLLRSVFAYLSRVDFKIKHENNSGILQKSDQLYKKDRL